MKERKDLADAFNEFSDLVFDNVPDEILANEIVAKYVFEFVAQFFLSMDEEGRAMMVSAIKDQTEELSVRFKENLLKNLQGKT